jgi:hypothetical protein
LRTNQRRSHWFRWLLVNTHYWTRMERADDVIGVQLAPMGGSLSPEYQRLRSE